MASLVEAIRMRRFLSSPTPSRLYSSACRAVYLFVMGKSRKSAKSGAGDAVSIGKQAHDVKLRAPHLPPAPAPLPGTLAGRPLPQHPQARPRLPHRLPANRQHAQRAALMAGETILNGTPHPKRGRCPLGRGRGAIPPSLKLRRDAGGGRGRNPRGRGPRGFGRPWRVRCLGRWGNAGMTEWKVSAGRDACLAGHHCCLAAVMRVGAQEKIHFIRADSAMAETKARRIQSWGCEAFNPTCLKNVMGTYWNRKR